MKNTIIDITRQIDLPTTNVTDSWASKFVVSAGIRRNGVIHFATIIRRNTFIYNALHKKHLEIISMARTLLF